MAIKADLRMTSRGLALLTKLATAPKSAPRVAQTAINSTLKRSKPKAVRAIRGQVALPRDYINERLREIPATESKLEGRLGAPKRGLLLSRFDFTLRTLARKRKRTSKLGKKGTTYQRNAGIRVRVKPGRAKLMPGAFAIKLRRGNAAGDGTNIGIAIRKRGAKGRSNYTVRYGPSLSQVYKSVRNDIAPDVRKDFERTLSFLIKREFTRG